MNRIAPTLIASLFMLSVPAWACAQAAEDEARRHFRLGEVEYEAGHFLDAAREFEESYRLSNRAELLHNVYVAYRDAGDLDRAADALRRFLAARPDNENAPLLRRRLAALEQSIAARAAGRPEPPRVEEPRSGTVSSAASPPPRSASGGGGLSPVGFIVAGVGAAALIGSAITGGLALGSESELATNCPNGECPSDYAFESVASDGRTLAITTDVLLGVGAAAVATGVVLIFVLTEGSSESASAGGACTPEGCMVYGRGRF